VAEFEIHGGKIVSLAGLDAETVSQALDWESLDGDEIIAAVCSGARRRSVTETQAIGVVKQVLQHALFEWLTDPGRQLEIEEGEVPARDGHSISLAHALVELVLSDESGDVVESILPEMRVLLRRTSGFLELYAPLRLSEEADLIVAKITGQRTAAEIADRSPHDRGEVVRLLAALVLTGLLEAVPVVSTEDVEIHTEATSEPPREARSLSVGRIAGAFAAAVIVLAVIAFLFIRPTTPEPEPSDGSWTVVVDMGCEPQDLERVLQKANQYPKQLRAVRASLDGSDPCWRLVWGEFTSLRSAEEAITGIPSALQRSGFEPHPVEISPVAGESAPPSGG